MKKKLIYLKRKEKKKKRIEEKKGKKSGSDVSNSEIENVISYYQVRDKKNYEN